ncbi:hypothetical protein L292_0554 [Acinetobacter junii CIP 107470 = MTCC 11364]|uniref:Uncharacterized protein n=1 Tax=Acinetobacter junii CIP 107470 = MTCC 11364 TaxID=1217666 RepID=S7WIT4_ACIJU|nr:hypothetical protein [Acinetobacter junii]ENV52052.1 hypothetical protein F953_00542 [Acinetobacter junii CIP 107470 = MTCC 11364]EPR83076.1 hypothetical protein L292_0554 [Acinetobacter junii CIP 107470 = MTCC 11364]
MSDLSQFEILLGRQPTEKEIQNLYRIKNTLQIQDNDALWLILCALESYNTLYSQYPDKIKALLEKYHQDLADKTPKEIKNTPVKKSNFNSNDQLVKTLQYSSIVFAIILIFGACFLSLGYLMATSTAPFWYSSQNIIANILRTPCGLVISFACLLCSIIPLYIHKDHVLNGKRLDVLSASGIFLLLALLTFISVT